MSFSNRVSSLPCRVLLRLLLFRINKEIRFKVRGMSQSPSGPLDTSSPQLLMFEVLMGVILAASYFWMRRRRRLLEVRAQQKYERLSRVEIGTIDVNAVSPAMGRGDSATMGTPLPSGGPTNALTPPSLQP